MANLIKWLPSTEIDIASYKIERGPAATGPFSYLTTILHDITDTTIFDGTHFFYQDTTGTATDWYRLIAVDTSGLESQPSVPFAVASPPPATPPETVGLTHNYGGVNNLQPVDPSGNPIEGVQIRVYFKTDYDANILNNPIGVTLSDSKGQWGTPIFVAPGFDYVIHFEKPGEFGPSTINLTV
jgi:hypothetical protein